MQIDIRQDELLNFDGDGIVVPTNSSGTMVEGVAAQVKEAVGPEVEQHVTEHAPIAVGASLVTESNGLVARYLIHAPLVEAPAMRVGIENVRRATRAGLLAATAFSMERIAIPAMGFGEEGVSLEEAARAIIDEIRGYKGSYPVAVSIVCDDPAMLEALRSQSQPG